MREISRNELIKEYEDYINNSTFEANQIEILGDGSNDIKELTSLYVKVLKDFTSDNDEGEKSVELYLTQVMEVSNIKGEYYVKTVKDNIILKIKQEVTKTDKAIEKSFKNLSWFESQLKDLKLSDEERNRIIEKKDKLLQEKYNVLSSFTNNISKEIKKEITKVKRKNMTKSVLKAVAMGTAAVAGIFLTSKIQTIAKDAGIDLTLEKKEIDKTNECTSTEKDENIAEPLERINGGKIVNKDITPNM